MDILSMENEMVAWLFTHKQDALSPTQMGWIGISFLVFFVFVCIVSHGIFKEDVKKLSWCISLFNSLAATIFGFLYVTVNYLRHKDFFFMGPDPDLIFYSVAPVDIIACIWFAVACIVDLSFGSMYYPKYIDVLTGWVHHFVYIWMMYFGITGNGLFVQAKPFASAFVYMLVEELPTFLMALGNVIPNLRVNLRFGISFLILRVMFHTYMISWGYFSKIHTPALCLYGLTLTLHVKWQIDWVHSYIRRRNEKKKEDKTK